MLYDNMAVNGKGHLTFAGYDAVELAETYGTPAMFLDEARIRSRCREYKAAMAETMPAGSCPSYAGKALSCKAICRIMAQEGMHLDVVSPGELLTACAAGFPMEDVYFHGNSKSDADIRFAMERGLGHFVCDNADELEAIARIAAERGIRQKVLLRLTPGIDPHTHEKISTGRIDCKFGAAVETGQAEELVLLALSKESVELEGYHCHIGSQIFDPAPFHDAARLMLEFVAHIGRAHGFFAPVLDLGGGLGVPYTEDQPKVDYGACVRQIGAWVQEICQKLQIAVPVILMEPGRSIIADAGMTLYTVNSIKSIPGFKNYVAVDGGMTDNPRYTLYEAEYTALVANRAGENAEYPCTLAGRCCESGDLIGENFLLAQPRRGDTVAVLTTGAYNYSMASHYNRVAKPPVILLTKDGAKIAVRRETPEDIMACDM